MSTKITAFFQPAQSIYVHICDRYGKVWNGSAFETYSAANYALYAIALTESGGSGEYSASVPAALTDVGQYDYFIYLQAGASPAEGDNVYGTGIVDVKTSAVVVTSSTEKPIRAAYTNSKNIYCHIRNSAGLIWNGTSFETYSAANYSLYRVVLTEAGASGKYFAGMPSGITVADIYEYFVFSNENQPAEGDNRVGNGTVDWNGSGVNYQTGDSTDTSIALISLAELKTKIKETNATDDAFLSKLINEFSQLCNDYCGRQLLSKAYTEYYNGNGIDKLAMRNFPVSVLSSLYISDSERTFGSDEAVDISADTMLNKDDGIITLWNDETSFTTGKANIKATYTAGWTLATVPYSLRLGIKNWIARDYHRWKKQTFNVRSETVGDMNTSYSTEDIPADVKLILDNYKMDDFGFTDFAYAE